MEQNRTQRNRRLWIGGGFGAIVLLACAAIALWLGLRRPAVLNPQAYVSVGRDAFGQPVAAIDTEAMLRDLHLPSPADDPRAVERYADVAAILGMRAEAALTADETARVTVVADTEALSAAGILVEPLSWEQPIGTAPIAAEREPAPSMAAVLAPGQPTATHADKTFAPTPTPGAQPGELLHSLVDADGCGYNLRAVCERVHELRDSLLKSLYGDAAYGFEKIQVSFSVEPNVNNCYQATYRCWLETADATPANTYFYVRVYHLTVGEHGVEFLSSTASFCRTEKDARRAPFDNATVLSGGGVSVPGKAVFDQNGFLLFPDCPTSYRMANGVYWSPTYDLLDEDMIWKLTAVDGHSLANLLRYARKEIYARYYAGFDERTEREFYEHYTSYPWYREMTPDRTADMTDAERTNIRLLREIQSLVEK